MKRGFTAVAAIALALLATTASATITGTSGQVTKIAPPPSVLFDVLESDTTMFAFDEQQNVTLAQPLSVDITAPGTYDDSIDLTPGTIPAGTAVSSHFVHSDKIGTDVPRVTLEGTVTTDQDILGIAILAKALNNSDYLGAPGTLYPTNEFGRGLNLDSQDDFVIQQIDNRTVVIHSDVRIHSDQVRIITKSPSPPGSRGFTQGFWGNKNGQALLVANDAFSPAKAVELGISGLCYVKVDSQAKSKQILPSTKDGIGLTGCSGLLDSGINTGSFNNLLSQTLALSYNILYKGGYAGQTLGTFGCAGVGPLTSSSTVEQARAYANYLIGNAKANAGDVITQKQIGDMNNLLGNCLNTEA
jgi:hypothetical protein